MSRIIEFLLKNGTITPNKYREFAEVFGNER